MCRLKARGGKGGRLATVADLLGQLGWQLANQGRTRSLVVCRGGNITGPRDAHCPLICPSRRRHRHTDMDCVNDTIFQHNVVP
ncbi:hypothetical protein TanjilG_20951 [Lupinus angustifolius]|uniref:Uncharacterized protein n=1 Tax=Lupinus angustifolius TaxID=3871 RepID=A0A1J7FNA8_LUPAN|nr:hypothetical protein TanjilG_20951 [Lupinus angustifolius]